MRAASSELDVTPGTVIDKKFKIERTLGEGGMGIVVRAMNLGLGSPVALKLLLPKTLADPILSARFVREARTVARLTSDYVARVHDVGTMKNGAPYIVMEYLEGETFSESLKRRGPFSVAEACGYMVQVCDALAEAHALGVIHRDLKLSNLFLAARLNGKTVAKVLDFGISKLAGGPDVDGEELTLTSSFLGTPRYMAPEQLISSREVDARSDIWSVGVCLHGILCGSAPFDGDSVASVTARVLNTEAPDLRTIRADIPAPLAEVVRKCMRRRPAERWQSANDLATALLPFVAPATSSHPNVTKIVAPPPVPPPVSVNAPDLRRTVPQPKPQPSKPPLDETRVEGAKAEPPPEPFEMDDETQVDGARGGKTPLAPPAQAEAMGDSTRVDQRPALARARQTPTQQGLGPPAAPPMPPPSNPQMMDAVLPAPPLSSLPLSAFAPVLPEPRTGGFGMSQSSNAPPAKKSSLAVIVGAGMLVGAAIVIAVKFVPSFSGDSRGSAIPATHASTDLAESAAPSASAAPTTTIAPSAQTAQNPGDQPIPATGSPNDWPTAPSTDTTPTAPTAPSVKPAGNPVSHGGGASQGHKKNSSGGIPDER